MPLILSGNTGTSTLDSSTGLTFSDSSLQAAAASPYVLKNRIINGAMVIDQRNAGASVTPSADAYTLDRWIVGMSAGSKFSVQQSSTAPTGFTNSVKITSLAATSLGSGDYYTIEQSIEGYNIADFNYGSANAVTITLSFWVQSSLTGTFGGSLRGASSTRSYPFTYTISVANTWEYKTVTVSGVTSGTWITNNGKGLTVIFGLGVGSTLSGTSSAWASTNYLSATGATSVVGTNGATFYITGVQLEIGTSATPFERRLYSTELALCQRYFQICGFSGVAYNTGEMGISSQFKVTMRAQASMSTVLYNGDNYTGSANTIVRVGVGNAATGSASYNAVSSGNNIGNLLTTGLTANNIYFGSFQASAEL